MSNTHRYGFDDRLFMVIGIPIVSLIVVVFFLNETPHSIGWTNFLVTWSISSLYTITYWLVSRWTIAHWRRRRPGIEQTKKRIVKTLLSLCAIVIGLELLCYFGYGWEDLITNRADGGHNILQTGPISMILVIAVTGIYEAIYFFKLYRRAELDKERLLRSQVENQLDALRKQVDPHFLFNSLNTLAAIIPEDAAAAQKFTERLSATYRRLLQWRHNPTVTLDQELEALQDYLHLLNVRFEGRLQVELNIAPALTDYFIAPLALQLLVENAVKHNEASLANPLVVNVYSEKESITVSNIKRLKAKAEINSTGFGLENLHDRVRYLSNRRIKIVDSKTTFSVTVPLLEMAPLAKSLLASKDLNA